MSKTAAQAAAGVLKANIFSQGAVRIIAATGASQFGFLEALTQTKEIDWSKVEMFHLDEYVGLPLAHPASFRKYLLARLITPTGIPKYHLLDAETNPQVTCERVWREIGKAPIEVAFVGIGENGHLAFK